MLCNGCVLRSRDGGVFHGGARVRQLRRHPHAAVAPRRHRPLPMQRVRAVQQDERHEPPAEAAAAAGTSAQRAARAARAPRRTQHSHCIPRTSRPPHPAIRARRASAPALAPSRGALVTISVGCSGRGGDAAGRGLLQGLPV